MKTYVLMVSEKFPKNHKRKGELTFFPYKIKNGEKIHTIRANYKLWEKRISEIKKSQAKLSVRVWEGEPYKSKQKEIFEFIGENQIDIQKLEEPDNFVWATVDGKMINWGEIAKNDGLSFDDFCDWFKVRSNKPMAIIHFSKKLY
jgi:hypothetical protein